MSSIAELAAELSALLSSAARKEQLCRYSSQAESAVTITLERAANFPAPDGSRIKLSPGNYRVDVLAEGHFLLSSASNRRSWIVGASRTWHELKVTSPLALSVPIGEHEENIVVLLPGGGGLLASSDTNPAAVSNKKSTAGSRKKSPSRVVASKSLPTPLIVESVLKWMPVGTKVGPKELKDLPIGRLLLLFPFLTGIGTIEPGSSPARFAPMMIPPNWVGATVVDCTTAPFGIGTASPGPFTPGEAVSRSPFAGYVTSTTPVKVTSSVSLAGRVVQLLVTSLVRNVGNTTLMDSTWTDVYQVLPQNNDPISFPGVIVATGRALSNAPFSSWVPDAESAFTTWGPGSGIPVVFELRVEGFTFATRSCKFNAQFYYPQSTANPTLLCQ